jgi:hypothetical protein
MPGSRMVRQPALRKVAHRHEWAWPGTRAEEGEYCRVCGAVRDRTASLPPLRLGLTAFSNLYVPSDV